MYSNQWVRQRTTLVMLAGRGGVFPDWGLGVHSACISSVRVGLRGQECTAAAVV